MPADRPDRPSSAVGPRVRPEEPHRTAPAPARRPAVTAAALALAGVALGVGALVVLDGGDQEAVRGPAAQRELARAADGQAAAARATTEPARGEQEAARQGDLPQLLTLAPSTPAGSAPPPAAPAPAALQDAAPARPALTVLNNSRITRLAARQAERYRDGGWPVAVVGNLRGRIAASTVYYAPGQQEWAQQVAEQFGLPRVLPRLEGLPGSGLTVVVTRDLA